MTLAALLAGWLFLGAVPGPQAQSDDGAALEAAIDLLRHSPWAQEKFILIPTGRMTRFPYLVGRKRAPDVLTPERLPAVYLVRWESAQPVTDAFGRLSDLGEDATARFLSRPPRAPAGLESYYVVTVRAKEPPEPLRYDLLAGFRPAELAERAELKCQTGRSIKAAAAVRTGTGLSAATHFYFSPDVKGQPLLTRQDDWVEFSFIGRHRTALKVKFKREALAVVPGLPKP